jgi:predicted phosphodiesterase
MSDIERELSRALTGPFTLATTLDLESRHRYVIFSDQHKGAGDKADEFRKCRDTYVTALEHYRDRGFSVILLGDVEELWEQGFKPVREQYDAVLRLEGSFPAGRYFRVWGNHDDQWMHDADVRKYLAPYMPTGAVYEGLRFELETNGEPRGRIFLVHGHQGTFESDKLRGLARFALKFYRLLQRWFGIGKTTPAEDACLRGEHDRQMYEWAATQPKLIMIAGHTHRPVWSSRTHLQKLQQELAEIEERPASPERDALIADKEHEIEQRRARMGDCNDVPMPEPCYFNTGCCRFDDGDITGMELENGVLRLIKWSAPERGMSSERFVLEEDRVAAILARLSQP